MTLLYIREAVVFATDIEASARFHIEAFGFEIMERNDDSILLGAPGAESGRLRLVRSEGGVGPQAAVWDLGPRLLGIYSHDLDTSAKAIADAGGRPRTPVTYPYGAASLQELVASGPDNVWWTMPKAVPGAHRPSDAYTADPARVHSELHTAVLVVDDHDAALAFFTAGGLDTVFDGEMVGQDFEELVGMPAGAALRLAFMGGPDHLPARFEIMSFRGTPTRDLSDEPVGLRRLVFVCDDAEATRDALVAAGGELLGDGAVRGPVGVILELVEEMA